jgi:hypothetical protein
VEINLGSRNVPPTRTGASGGGGIAFEDAGIPGSAPLMLGEVIPASSVGASVWFVPVRCDDTGRAFNVPAIVLVATLEAAGAGEALPSLRSVTIALLPLVVLDRAFAGDGLTSLFAGADGAT